MPRCSIFAVICFCWFFRTQCILLSARAGPKPLDTSTASFVDRLWAGEDLAAWADIRHSNSERSRDGVQQLQFMGLYNTGTNLVTDLLQKNYPEIGTNGRVSPSYWWEQEENADSDPGDCHFWKHSSLSIIKENTPEVLEGCSDSLVAGVAMIRNPLSWLSSMKNVAYDLGVCTEGDDWLTRPCTYPDGPDASQEVTVAQLNGKTFANIEDIWTKWTHNYESLRSFGFHGAVVVKYEDLVQDTNGTFRQITDALNLPPVDSFKDVNSVIYANPTGYLHFGVNARDRAVEKIATKSYLKEFTRLELHDACKRLDQAMMLRLGYDDCQTISA